MTDWGDVAARARGLASQLLAPAQARALCDASDLAALMSALAAAGWPLATRVERSADPRAIEFAVRRRAGARLRVLARWARERAALLSPLFDDEDRRSLRAIVRGAMAGIPAEERVRGVIPTPSLPLRALEQLSRTHDVASIASLLTVWRHPCARGVATEARRPHPDLFHIEVAIARTFAERGLAAARKAGPPMRLFVERTIDLENLWTALMLSAAPGDVAAADLFVPGGRVITLADLETAARLKSIPAFTSIIRPRVAGTPLAAALEPGERSAEDRSLDALCAEFRRVALRNPLSSAPVILFVLRQRRETRTLLHLVWGIALGAPRHAIETAIGAAA